MANERLAGQRALVTGASSGIGREIAKILAGHGADLVLVARREERLRELADELRAAHGIEVRVEAADLSRPEAPAALFAATEGAGVAIDILINNAGLGVYEDFAWVEWERWAPVIQVNVTAVTELCHRFVPRMVTRGRGRVMNVGSISAFLPTPNFAVYGSTKAYLLTFSEALDYELRRTGVRVIGVHPGGTWTEFMDHANQKMKPMARMAMMSAERCAAIAVKKMLRGRRTVVTGFWNALGMWLLRFVPRALYPRLAGISMGMAVEKASVAAPPAASG